MNKKDDAKSLHPSHRVQCWAVQERVCEDLQVLRVLPSRQWGGAEDQKVRVTIGIWVPWHLTINHWVFMTVWSLQTVCFGSIKRCATVSHRRRRPSCGGSNVTRCINFYVSAWSHTLCDAGELIHFCSCSVHVEQVFDATNTTRERRETIIQFAEQNGFKVPCWVTILGGDTSLVGIYY